MKRQEAASPSESLIGVKDLSLGRRQRQMRGTWRGNDPGDTWEFTQQNKIEDHLVVDETQSRLSEGGQGEFVVHLVVVEGMTFLDLFPAEPGFSQNGLSGVHFVAVHTFWRVFQVEPSLKLAYFSWREGVEDPLLATVAATVLSSLAHRKPVCRW